MKQSFLASLTSRRVGPGSLLALATLFALVLANSPLGPAWESILHAKALGLSVHHWINDGLMALFFFVVGLEIKRELVQGELASPRRAALPVAAALGGMVLPALVYLAFAYGHPGMNGWGIPMATDIAFAVAVLGLFGRRVPNGLRIFLLALAIVDDLGAVLVIALFYAAAISGPYLAAAAGALLVTKLALLGNVRKPFVYLALALLTWFFFLRSGVHATIAGAVLGLLVPLETGDEGGRRVRPLQDLLHGLEPWVNFGVLPLFALANAGVRVSGVGGAALFANPIFLGVVAGLVLGKPAGILLGTQLSTWLRLAERPRDLGVRALVGVGFLGGIGFTMALFVSNLALTPAEESFSKFGILAGSLVAAGVGAFVLHFALPKEKTRAP